MRIGNRLSDIAMVSGAMAAVAIMAFSVHGGPRTPWEGQIAYGRDRAYVVQLGSDGCYWRTYMGTRYVDSRVDILPDADGGHENCPYRRTPINDAPVIPADAKDPVV